MKRSVKLLSAIFAIILVFMLAACGQKTEPPTIPTEPSVTPTEPTEPTMPDLSMQQAVVNTEGMTDLQKAIVITAESYFLRGGYAQYDQYSMTAGIGTEVGRRTYGIMAPEDYTAQFVSYTDCSSFVYDVYRHALGMSISSTSPFTKTYCSSTTYRVLYEQPVKSGFADMSKEELDAKGQAFRDALQPGDIIVYRNAKNTSGHAMLYVGNGMKIHSTGTSYDYTNAVDKGRETGTYRYDSIDGFFTPGASTYLFDKSVYVILRPLAKFSREIPAHTQQRMGPMRGIIAEKLSSHTYGQTVNPGETITFTFRMQNKSTVTKPLTINDTVPDGTSYVSGAQKVNGKDLSWTVVVPAGESVEVSYTVKVDETTPTGTYIQSKSSVSGIDVNCPRVMVAKTLTAAQQQATKNALEELKSDAQGIDLANAIYQKVCGKTVFTHQDTDTLWNDIASSFDKSGVFFTSNKPLATMVAPRLYGGRSVSEMNTAPAAIQYRTRLVTNRVLVIGDVILADDRLYLFTGDGLRDLTDPQNTGLKNPESLLSAKSLQFCARL
jgi:uncharacterized repeat protein (TIGR01451 family)